MSSKLASCGRAPSSWMIIRPQWVNYRTSLSFLVENRGEYKNGHFYFLQETTDGATNWTINFFLMQGFSKIDFATYPYFSH